MLHYSSVSKYEVDQDSPVTSPIDQLAQVGKKIVVEFLAITEKCGMIVKFHLADIRIEFG